LEKQPVAPDDFAALVQINHDPYKKTHEITGSTYRSHGGQMVYRLQAVLGEDGQSSDFYLYVEIAKFDWMFLDSAWNQHGEELPVIKLDSNIETRSTLKPTVREKIQVKLTLRHIAAGSLEGFDIKIQGKRGAVIAGCSPEYVQGFIQKFLEVSETLPKPGHS
jgi:hypothetical protein